MPSGSSLSPAADRNYVVVARVIFGFLPPLALMGVIFLLSAQSDLSTGLGFWDLLLRKLAHMISYGLLTLLWWRALAPLTGRALPAAILISLVYAMSDEYHQSFVEGRVGSPVDVAIDTAGIAMAAALVRSGKLTRIGERFH